MYQAEVGKHHRIHLDLSFLLLLQIISFHKQSFLTQQRSEIILRLTPTPTRRCRRPTSRLTTRPSHTRLIPNRNTSTPRSNPPPRSS